jgi:hypothetical protein
MIYYRSSNSIENHRSNQWPEEVDVGYRKDENVTRRNMERCVQWPIFGERSRPLYEVAVRQLLFWYVVAVSGLTRAPV